MGKGMAVVKTWLDTADTFIITWIELANKKMDNDDRRETRRQKEKITKTKMDNTRMTLHIFILA